MLDFLQYEDLIDYIERYSIAKDARERHPELSLELAIEAMNAADECPCCLCRFLARGGHSSDCELKAILDQ